MMTFEQVLERIAEKVESTREKGAAFERATKFYLENDSSWKSRLSEVWLWGDAPTHDGQDRGIDLVALDATDGTYWAIQCKCFEEMQRLTLKNLSTFFASAAAKKEYGHYMVVDTTETWTKNLKDIAEQYGAVRIDLAALAESDADWQAFVDGEPQGERATFDPMEHQETAIQRTLEGFKAYDRGKLIMACGTGKTLTALRLAERQCPEGLVLVLAPSISLVSQTMRVWTSQARVPMTSFVVCSDAKASRTVDAGDNSVLDIPYPATTNPETLAKHVQAARERGGMTVVFSTYQSIQVSIDAQALGMDEFDLCICDEAHRTTGAFDTLKDADHKSPFVKVHDSDLLHAKKRLYMTATPRVYGTKLVKKAKKESYEVASMDDEATYGPEFYRLSFGQAVARDLLTDYRVIVLAVSEAMASGIDVMTVYDDDRLNIPDTAKILGCWKGLTTKGHETTIDNLVISEMDSNDPEITELTAESIRFSPMHRAVAFSTTIKDSKKIAKMFNSVVESYSSVEEIKLPLEVEVHHVDGTMDSATRHEELCWLENVPSQDVCHVLSNARCLAEGIDVPDLDAVLFMQPRKSKVDIIQAVGRVMRKAPGKEFGYVIVPVVVPEGMTPEEALDNSDAFEVVWEVLQALRSHDERLDAKINSIRFDREKEKTENIVGRDGDEAGSGDDGGNSGDGGSGPAQGAIDINWSDKLEAVIVKKCGTRIYWDAWAEDVAGIAERHIKRISHIIETDAKARNEFTEFLASLRDSLNPGISEQEAIEMLAQHMITLPIFETLFGSGSFVKSNPVSIAMQGMVDVLQAHDLDRREDSDILEDLYESVRTSVSVIQTKAGRQAIIKELYEGFFSQAFKSTAQKMGIVYTPNEIVDYILYATDRMLRQEFGESMGTPGVHILDPFSGTGTFIANLIDSDLISDEELPYKYEHDLHANEIILLAYYIMVVNVEQSYHNRMGGDYHPFPGGVLADTFQLTETDNQLDLGLFIDNSEREMDQMDLPIRVIVGNPPYSVGQGSENDNNKNESYPTLDINIRRTYAARSKATNKNSLYDSYIRAFRWASDRIGDKGIVCFVTNAGWLESEAGEGIRRSFADEFNSIYIFHLRGNQRTQGEESRREGGKIFGQGSRAPIAITMLVKNPNSVERGVVHFKDIGNYLSREEKLRLVSVAAREGVDDWNTIVPDSHGDWLNQRDDSFYDFAPMGLIKKKPPLGIFEIWSAGVKTNRDPWTTNFSKQRVENDMRAMSDFYNAELDRWMRSTRKPTKVEDFISGDTKQISWTFELKRDLTAGKRAAYDPRCVVNCSYRPFVKEWLYFNRQMNNRVYLLPEIFPNPALIKEHSQQKLVSANDLQDELTNLVICLTGGKNQSCLITDRLPDLHYIGDSQCFPLYWYEETANGYIRRDAISDESLRLYRETYPCVFAGREAEDGGEELNKEDIFYYVYGILHSMEYRERFAANLAKELPRIPFAKDFKAFSIAGRKLADWHLNYETVEPWPLDERGDSANPVRTERMRFGKCKRDERHPKGEDMSVLHVAENLTLEGIPLDAYNYVVNGKSAIGWLMDRYRMTTDKASGIVNDPNDYSDDPRYIVDLVKRVVRVSMETLEIIRSLPPLEELPQPANWPEAWRQVQ